MPTEHDWEDEEPCTEEDATKRLVKRIDKLNKGICGNLWKMHQECHKQVYEEGNMDHLPMTFVRYQKGEDESTRELFYICRKCISDYLIAHPEAMDDVLILRGEPTKELKDFVRKRAEEEYQKEVKRQEEEQKRIDEVRKSDALCPICAKPHNQHSDEDFKRCLKEYAQVHPDQKDRNKT